ncbi:MAG: hypothetical protein HY808_02830 [Nitrospirae bacterium]|nr:hypothetical protein [Nitrospirota bacterium]
MAQGSEDNIRDLIMEVLYSQCGEKGSWSGAGKNSQFKIDKGNTVGECFAEKPLDYKLPNNLVLSHKSDILFRFNAKSQSDNSQNKYISIEIKHLSSVTDQFKSRSFDMIHLKKTYGSQIYGIMVYVWAHKGLSIPQAEKICYAFDFFFGIESSSIHEAMVWSRLTKAIEVYLKQTS